MTLTITAESMAGDHVSECAEEMVGLANRLGVDIKVQFNGVALIARPGGSAEKLEKGYYDAMRMGEDVKMKMVFS